MKMENWPIEESAYLAIRKTRGRRAYLDIRTASGSIEATRRLSYTDDKELTAWAYDNPVVGIASCRIIVDDVFK